VGEGIEGGQFGWVRGLRGVILGPTFHGPKGPHQGGGGMVPAWHGPKGPQPPSGPRNRARCVPSFLLNNNNKSMEIEG
jgi:hypothetical protein